MGSACRYWTHIRLEASGSLREREIAALKAFFQQQFPDWTEANDIPDLQIQRQLVKWMRVAEVGSVEADLAEGCLRCFVSHQIPMVCFSLEQRFGTQGGFSRAELYPYVMDDFHPLNANYRSAEYRPVAVRIVQIFDPEQSNLSTWTKRLVLQQKDLNAALADWGIYLASDWAILNHTTPSRISRLLAGKILDAEIQRACQILESYHVVYRQARLKQRSSGAGRKCTEPNSEQLQAMLQHLEAQGIDSDSPQQLLRELRALAQHLRQFKRRSAISLDDEKTSFLAEQQQVDSPDEDHEQDQFLSLYRQESEQCLSQAVKQVLDDRVTYLSRRKPPKDQVFLKALDLFHREGKSMTEIAPLVGLQKQFQVTRLLSLKELRADVRQTWLKLLHQKLPQLLQDHFDPQQLEPLDQQLHQRLNIVLEELIDRIIAEDATDSYSPKRHSRSLFTACLCQYLETWSN
jgi:hypothetical protein